MRFWVGITDNNWFDFLASRQPDEVNFWQPGGNQTFRFLEPGEPFLFKLHSPQNYIVGGGYFVHHTFLPLSLAWDAFGEKNGAASYDQFRGAIAHYRERRGTMAPDPQIGCIILTQPFFFPREEWIPFQLKAGTMQGKGYNAQESEGAALWQQVQDRLLLQQAALLIPVQQSAIVDTSDSPSYGAPYLTRARLGQGSFRALVTDAYTRRCAITGERTLPALQASHIKPVSESGPNRVSNGLLLRADLHILFDKGYLTIDEELRVEVSPRIKEEFENGRDYYRLHGQRLVVVPEREIERPERKFIEWHNERVYVA